MLEMNGIPAADWLVFDPADIERLFVQNEVIARKWTTGLTVPHLGKRSDDQLRHDIKALTNDLRLPFGEDFRAFISGELRRVEEELSNRLWDEAGVWREMPSVVLSRVTSSA